MPTPRTAPAKISIDARHAFRGTGDSGRRAAATHPCKCKKTRCLMMYCACFANGARCKTKCTCVDCANDGRHPKELFSAVQHVLMRNNIKENGCQCVKSRCAKLYCVCMMKGRKCSVMCLCTDCSNMDWGAANPRKRAPKKQPVGTDGGGGVDVDADADATPDASGSTVKAPDADADVDAPAFDAIGDGMPFVVNEEIMQAGHGCCPPENRLSWSTSVDLPFPLDVATCPRTALLRGIEERMGIELCDVAAEVGTAQVT